MNKENTINWDLVKEEDCLFAINESKEKLKCSIEFNNELHKKIFFLITILLTLLTGLSGFFFSHNCELFLSIPIFIIIFSLFKSLCHISSTTKAKNFHSPGNLPNEILKEKNMKDSLYMKECELMSYQQRIIENMDINKESGKLINKAINTILYGFISAFVLFGIIKILVFILI